jgi:hypothetical protein
MREGLLWAPNGLLSEEGALTGKAAQGSDSPRSA